jgi:hypothetical protein
LRAVDAYRTDAKRTAEQQVALAGSGWRKRPTRRRNLIVQGVSDTGSSLLEIQSKRTITFAPKDSIFQSFLEISPRRNLIARPIALRFYRQLLDV